jgi:hypothetical protein
VRLAALLGVGQSLAIGLSIAEAPNEWPWAYAMMIGIHLVLLLTPSAQYAAVDAVRGAAADERARVARRLLIGWGLVHGLIGLIAGIKSVGDDFLAPRGRLVGYPRLELFLGDYNMLAALLLIVLAALMIAAALTRSGVLGLGAATTATVAALTIYIQLGRTEICLGGNPTSTAVFACVAVVGFGTMRSLKS